MTALPSSSIAIPSAVLPPDLIDACRDRRLILFVGAGISRGLGLPSFSELIDFIALQLKFDPAIFASFSPHSWVLSQYYELEKGSIGDLRSHLDREWHKSGIDIGASKSHALIVRLNATLLYTTNYDRWLENAYVHWNKPFSLIRNASEIRSSHPTHPQIIKFHGDFSDDNSIVLTEDSYFERMSFEHPLDIKLRSDAIGRSILFLGYSLDDLNLRYLLFRLNKMWQTYGKSAEQPKSFIFLPKPNPANERVLRSRGVTPIVSSLDDPGEGTTAFLSGLVSAAGL